MERTNIHAGQGGVKCNIYAQVNADVRACLLTDGQMTGAYANMGDGRVRVDIAGRCGEGSLGGNIRRQKTPAKQHGQKRSKHMRRREMLLPVGETATMRHQLSVRRT